MRKILFKAKRIDNGEWINGDLITTPFIRNETQENIPYILDITKADYDCFEDLSEGNGIFEVDPSTICQYTGLTDKNGKEIWENDILKMHSDDLYNDNVIVKYEKSAFVAISNLYQRVFHLYEKVTEHTGRAMYDVHFGYEVIGNVFDNPKLLENEVK